MASTKKSATKSTKKGPKPSSELVKEIENILEKHHFTGSVTMAAVATKKCEKGETLRPVTRQTPSGRTVTRLECVKIA